MNFNIVICDDEVIQVDIVEKLILETVQQINKEVNIIKFFAGEDLVNFYESNNEIHIIFLDMEMNGINGIECAKRIRKKHKKVVIIFITGYKQYVFDVFEVNTFRYLLKPIKKDQFKKALMEAIKSVEHTKKINKKKQKEFLVINKNKERIIIAYNSIIYFEKYKNKVLLICDNKKIEFYGTFNELNVSLDTNNFIRIHQGYIVNINKIEVVTSKEVFMKNGQKLPVSRRNAKEVKESFLSNKGVK